MEILLVEDNNDLAIELADFFEAQGHSIDAATDGITALHLAIVNHYDVIVLDLNLPGLDGLTVCQRLRQEEKWTPILMLTARDTLTDRIKGFEYGADDYLVKPFSLKELNLRLDALVRRSSGIKRSTTLNVAGLELQINTRQVMRNGIKIELTVIEFQILELLMRKSPHVVSRDELSRAIWNDSPTDADTLKVHIHHLRNAIDKPFEQPLLHTIRGIGYQLAENHALSA
ncbi:MAG: response regulator transcription factor [Methylicorpusculum sp.]|uniref:response regulator transcription factor n=1 Tax=Methylicorpusculum sp. TaxID=2713644 RepID=UPI002722E45B|nr:response regulator transcription factor [Methylicorpusculum sp.]MDO8842875.1 response regulator transcription factor [Methylicorpusculum sp.]MDO8940825.1 response regulator transcription factor [Methylicorpusculum sp.]MDP2179971.1 response regulator transcription factor [Methylicorpusculum sp.]MDP2204412.1 response regulator transcription factor [Methylicorpusculum sp.]MDP3527824.1 response regulator transcription factor [Methylicorpusculum sp.]